MKLARDAVANVIVLTRQEENQETSVHSE